MNPGTSPIFLSPYTGGPTNVPPPGNDPFRQPPGYALDQFPDLDPVPPGKRNQGNP